MMSARSISFLFLALCLSGCVRTEVLNAPLESVDTATVYHKPHKPHEPTPPRDTVVVEDTARVPIGFNPSVGDWEDTDVEL